MSRRGTRRRALVEEPDNHDRWLVSYADFITLLFAFFVVMYGVSSVNQTKYLQLSDALGNAFGGNDQLRPQPKNTESPLGTSSHSLRLNPIPPLVVKSEQYRRERERMVATGLALNKQLAPLVAQGKVRVMQTNQGIRIDIADSLLFASGSATLADAALPPLNAIASTLRGLPYPLQIEGHTDDRPIRNLLFDSNWELSAMRATAVLHVMAEAGIAASRLAVQAFADTRPVADNSTPEGRTSNRRVSVMVMYQKPSDQAQAADMPYRP
ncbi:flagellar motor protein MotB [Methylobacillus flagellatus]|uniref:flagellar motor protein MotB n=1 Tax=Methylobacillus flagellatus TaxID=405 RepID=UPI0010F71A70|nr:flagellar motor protein MotB [Methylobacillus flagellatus]